MKTIDTVKQEDIEAVLKQCEAELMKMAVLDGKETKANGFQTSVFRFIWLKLSRKIQDRANFYSKGMSF